MAIPPLYGNSTVHTKSISDISPLYAQPSGTCVPLALNRPGSDRGVWWDVPGPGHAITFGANRSGKGAGCIVPALLVYTGSVVVLDPKAETVWASWQQRQKLGQRTVILDPWDEVNRRYGSKVGVKVPTTKFNPLSILDPRAPEFADDVTLLAEGVITSSGLDSHWTDSARELVAGLIAAVAENAPGVGSFDDVRRLLIAPDDKLEKAVNDIVKSNPDSLAGRKLARFIPKPGKSATNEISSIRSTAMTQTAIFDAVTLLAAMETGPDAFDMTELAAGAVTLYIVLPADKLTSHGRWMRLVLTLAYRAVVSHHTAPDPPILFILDELGTITSGDRGGGIPLVTRAAGLAAGLGLRLWCFFQDINQLQRDYPESWETLLANAAMIQILRVNENSTARYFSEFIGTTTITQREIRFGQGGGLGMPQYFERPARLPQEIIQMEVGKTLILFAGGSYYELSQVSYFKEARFNGKYLPNPNHPHNPPKVLQQQSAGLREAIRQTLLRWLALLQGNTPIPDRPEPPPPYPAPPRVGPRPGTTVVRCVRPSCRQALRVPDRRKEGWVTCPACRNRWKLAANA
jgi:type IV secretion system protein VirD4